jgi:hypothetical protein
LRSLLDKGLGLFLHPYFTGQRHLAKWGTVNESHIDGSGRSILPDFGGDEHLLEDWRRAITEDAESAGPEFKAKFDHDVPGLQIATSQVRFGDLGVESKLDALKARMRADHKLSWPDGEKARIPGKIYERNFELKVEFLHRLLREKFGLDPATGGARFRTVLLSAPLRMMFSGVQEDDESVPSSYRGGVWIFAGTERRYGRRRREKLEDLMRLCLLTGMSSVEARASKSLSEGILRHAVRTAAAAIMGRNMSHNIGSHVLARYSSKIGSEKIEVRDDKADSRGEFLAYLQRRMDFLAEVATSDQAFWSESLWLHEQVGRLNYTRQKERFFPNDPIVLKYITGKDSLPASVEWGRPTSLLDAGGGIAATASEISKDYLIACPGGEMGIHALFVILENVIRNSARHGSSTEAENETVKIFVHAIDEGDTEFLTIEIIDPRAPLNEIDDEEVRETRPHLKINKMLKEKLVNPDGTPNPRNWGVREMQICAHYLRELSFSDLDSLPHESHPVLRAGVHSLGAGRGCLKYTLYLKRAKLTAVVMRSGSSRDADELRRRGLHVECLESGMDPDWKQIATRTGGYGFLLVEEGISIPGAGTSGRASLPVRTMNFSKVKIDEAIDGALRSSGTEWMERLHKEWAEICRDKRAAWANKPLWGVVVADNLALKYGDVALPSGPAQLSEGLFAVNKVDDRKARSRIAPLPDDASILDWHRNLHGHAIAAAWIAHPFMQELRLGGASLGQAALVAKNPEESRMWISAEAALSDSPHSAYLRACTHGTGWEILAAAVPRVAVLDERVQSSLDKVVRGDLKLRHAWFCMGVWVPWKNSPSELLNCDLDTPSFVDCQKFLKRPTDKDEQFPIDVLVVHLTVLERLKQERRKSLKETLAELVAGTEASEAEIVIVTGRGVPAVDIDNVRYLPISALLESLVMRPSKLALMRTSWSSGRTRNVAGLENKE